MLIYQGQTDLLNNHLDGRCYILKKITTTLPTYYFGYVKYQCNQNEATEVTG